MTRRTAPRIDDGTSLAEVLVAAMLLVLVAALTGTLFSAGQRSASQTTGRVQTAETQRTTFDSVMRLLRTATPVGLGSGAAPAVLDGRASEVTFHANIAPGGPPSRVRLAVEADPVDPTVRNLTQTTTPGVWDAATGTYTFLTGQRSRVLARNVANTSTEPVFRYFQPVSEPPATACTSTSPGYTTGGCELALTGSPATLPTAERPKVRSMSITLTVSTPAVRSGSTTVLRSRVQLAGTTAVTG